MFLTDLIRILKSNKSSLDAVLRTLLNRGLVTRQKQINSNTSNSYTSHFYYSITDQGGYILAEKEKEPKFASLFDSLKTTIAKNILDQKKNSISTYLGINQKVILTLFRKRNSLFFTDLKNDCHRNESCCFHFFLL